MTDPRDICCAGRVMRILRQSGRPLTPGEIVNHPGDLPPMRPSRVMRALRLLQRHDYVEQAGLVNGVRRFRYVGFRP